MSRWEFGGKYRGQRGARLADNMQSERKKQWFNCIDFTAGCLAGKLNDLRWWIGSFTWDITATETWVRDWQGWQFNIQGFRCYWHDEEAGRRGVWNRRSVRCLFDQGWYNDNTHWGHIWVAVQWGLWVDIRNRKGMVILTGLYYKPPFSQWELAVQIYRNITDSCKKCIEIMLI